MQENVLNQAVQSEFEATFKELFNNAGVRSIVLMSGKPNSFIAGADIK